uniref:Protein DETOXIFICATION n=1 Tax=Tetraselmis chuii TaxID=63592 RepID=A0A7S1X7L9_9CHLO
MGKHPAPALLGDILRQGFAVSVRSVGLFVFLGSAGVAVNKLGAVPLAVHEITRQVWFASVMMFESFNVATQTLVAGVIGSGDTRKASRILRRTSLACVAAGCLICVLIYIFKYKIAALFTTSPEVITLVAQLLTLCAIFSPLDGIVLILEGALTGAMQVGFVARSVAVSCVLGVSLLHFAPVCTASVLGVWMALKAMMMLRLGTAGARLMSKQSPLYTHQPA